MPSTLRGKKNQAHRRKHRQWFVVQERPTNPLRSEHTMNTMHTGTPISKPTRWAGRALSGLVVLFLTLDAVMKLLALPQVAEAAAPLGWNPEAMLTLGALLLLCTVLYVVPRTAVLGAVLLTAYLGGTVATHARIASPLFTHTLFGVYLGMMLWAGLYLRDARLRALAPWRRESE
jgi:hypothetical protein